MNTTTGILTLAVTCTACLQPTAVAWQPGTGALFLGSCSGCGLAFRNRAALLEDYRVIHALLEKLDHFPGLDCLQPDAPDTAGEPHGPQP